ncbi:RsiV family protein [Winogradskyella psychrotolerans]|uniref:RsiV family protein n=1 Tax=Winogradskyella psychrotolerans TaxID=1344585 RepID=UPI001C074AB1|nr:RsiV family protein [Winogradskyella psychrotolerans]MBU2928631.1 RsiV family protein [Winogradskyella psychrotolerans]
MTKLKKLNAMKSLYLFIFILLFSNCKNDKQEDSNSNSDVFEVVMPAVVDTLRFDDSEIETFNKSIAIELKQKQLIEKKDESDELQELIIDKTYSVEKTDYTMNFKYPLLNTSFKTTHSNFNDFINDYYINISKTEQDILESKLLCDSIEAKTFREERYIDYKIYNLNDQLISVLFYKENFYSGAVHPSYSFDGFNFDLNRGVFMTYEDFFNQDSEPELVVILNENITKKIGKGDLYYECWELSTDDFIANKNNFVLNQTYVEFYFDDCVVCPSYTGTYSIEVPLVDLQSVLKKYETNPLVF